ncbi:MAG: hypothetical protein INR73_20100 [Williamsia sp.]|nr:hypothetical protein [Williamsia sp.]
MNSSMFLPQVAEQDIYNASGQQEDDVNTVVEYIDQVILGHHDNTPEDEDDDSGQNFHPAKDVNYCFQPLLITVKSKPIVLRQKSYPNFQVGKISTIYNEIISPPPECC